PIFYFILIYRDKPVFVKKGLRSSLFDRSSDICVIFNADDLLVDFNESAKQFFAFTNNDIFKLSIKKFISEYVPLGSVPSDSFSVEQIYVKGKDEERRICQLDYRKISYFRNVTRCSFFVLHDITELLKSFSDLQQASMTDNITGLLGQHVLAKKIREINMYRKFPYSVAACSVQLKNNSRQTINSNIALIHVSECIRAKIRGTDFASYENGKIILLFPAELDVAQNVMDRIEESINDDDFMEFDIDFSYGLATRDTPDTDIQETINKAHSLMFEKNINVINN
ncbi:MAG: GGDEF domain-containing protein, partial [Treponema sp.]|nr:GGDEF domain-containing protein [Candidatus Treponema merdequi]